MRRNVRFSPTLDSLPPRIAPSDLGVTANVASFGSLPPSRPRGPQPLPTPGPEDTAMNPPLVPPIDPMNPPVPPLP